MVVGSSSTRNIAEMRRRIRRQIPSMHGSTGGDGALGTTIDSAVDRYPVDSGMWSALRSGEQCRDLHRSARSSVGVVDADVVGADRHLQRVVGGRPANRREVGRCPVDPVGAEEKVVVAGRLILRILI